MLERIREGSQGFWARAILVLVILTFALAGIGSYLTTNTDQPVAAVNGTEITQSRLEQAYQNERARMEQQYGDAFSQLMSDSDYMKNFRRNLLDRLVAETLMEQTARDMGLRVSDEEIKQSILAMPEFQVGGSFNNDRYLAVLRQSGLQPSGFRDLMRKDMTRRQLVEAVMGTEFVLEGEARRLLQLQQQTRDLAYVTVPAEQFKDAVSVSEQEVANHYQTNLSQYDTPEKVALRYVTLSMEQLAGDIDVTEEELSSYYEQNQSQYRSEKQVRAAHILIEFGDDKSDAQQQAESLLKELEQGASFADLAKQHSADTFSAENGGDLDWFGRDVMAPEFEQAAFALEKGQVSDVVETEFGFHLIKVTDIKPEQVQELAEVKDEVKQAVQEQKAEQRFYDLQQEMAQVAFEMPDNLDEVAAIAGQPIETTKLFSRADAPEPISQASVLERAFSAELVEERVNSDIIELDDGQILVLRVDDYLPERTKALEEVSDEIRENLLAEKAQQAALDWTESLISMEAEARQQQLAEKGLEWQQHQNVARQNGEVAPSIVNTAFSLSPEADQNLDVATVQEGAALVKLNQVHQSQASDEQMLSMIRERLAGQKGQTTYSAMIEALKAKADIEYYQLSEDS
ncbi:Peptidylprolyl isomerase [Saliniradius amylolyticus]|uniref:Periplasmic chaperone PpiD n=1 Tax=Saliniradius amylolyticus TaxID=2183582 RepID=A0A2S2E6I1_9ALTE|nr:SurA N-terminal domain-containing protein [Saliniradius amylolyticus]AWL12577.1 Peptidylprolyl isomerase [Saliniradius amylolyticus]